MIIDIHHHILPKVFVETLGQRLGSQSLAGPAPEWSPQISLDLMDRMGIELAVTSFGPPGFWFGDAEETRILTRRCNEYAADLKRDYPGRFGMFAVLPIPNIDDCLTEIAYAFEVLGAVGVELMTNCAGRYPGDKAFVPILEELNRRHAVIFVHPVPAAYAEPYFDEIPAPTLEFPFDTTRAAMSLLHTGALARFGDIRFLLSHGGGCVPFLAGRMARLMASDRFRAAAPEGGVPELSRLYFDTALSANQFVFSSLSQLVAPDHILFGSDYPQAPEATTKATIDGLSKLGLAEDTLRQIRRDNALKLLPRLAAR